jgi:hypothetical protein
LINATSRPREWAFVGEIPLAMDIVEDIFAVLALMSQMLISTMVELLPFDGTRVQTK